MEVVHEGYLVKSPPEKRILKAKWRQRWFVLRHSGLLPGQFILEYFTDSTCKKLKGKIDLDQCEQVDAGVAFEGKKTNYQYMFDIRTPKRTYYLVAETESTMNKWVDCICSVCGLKIHIEEDYLAPLEKTTADSVVTAAPVASQNVPHRSESSHPPVKRSESNPYIPISECHTGKPVINGNPYHEESHTEILKEVPLMSANTTDWIHRRSSSSEFYDHPRPVNPATIEKSVCSDVNSENMYKVPLQLKCPVTTDMDNAYNTMLEGNAFHTLPPRVNWHTYPNGSIQSATLGRFPHNKSDVVYDQVPSVHSSNRDIYKKTDGLATQLDNVSLKNSSISILLSSSQKDICLLQKDSSTDAMSKVPPRPPKPSKLREKRHRYENFELPVQSSKTDASLTYDVPPPASKNISADNQLVSQTVSSLKDESSEELSPLTKVPLPSTSPNEGFLDDTYDFPKFRSEDNINATVPVPTQNSSTSQRQRCHAYTNAPPGLFNNKELIFNYEYRPSLNTSDAYISIDSNKPELYASAANDVSSPQTPTVMGAYANVPTSPSFLGSCQSDAPPVVNRELKPKKGLSSEDRNSGPFSFLTLQPPPVCRSRTKSNKRSFRKPRAGPSPTPGSNGTPPPIPNRFRHHHEVSATSDDDLSSSGGSRRNSSNDEQGRHFFAPCKKDEIQYLDLDLDSEPSQSPKSPERLTASTVYKKVDFVKTKAFNEMRQNVEESYRKSQ